MLYPLLAWFVAFSCVAILVRVNLRVAAIARPTSSELVTRVREQLPPGCPGHGFPPALLAELDDLLREVDQDSRVAPELLQGLARATLATGTGLAILAALAPVELTQRLTHAALSFCGGVAGAVGVALAGRRAKLHAKAVREHWSEMVRRARREIAPN